MRVAVAGFQGPIAQAVRAELARRGHSVTEGGAECAIFLPGSHEELASLAAQPGLRRLVLRSHAYVYGSNPKNPGFLTEDRVSLLPEGDPAQRWLKAEEMAARHPSWAAIRITHVAAPEEGDPLVQKLTKRAGSRLAGRDPNVQFISVSDAARALVAAAESNASGVFNASGTGAIPLKTAMRAAGTRQLPVLASKQLDALKYNWTVSGERAARELGFEPQDSSLAALASLLAAKPGVRTGLLSRPYDDWGLDVDYIRAWGWWFAFLRKVYWRIDFEGMENIPAEGRALFTSNHRGFMPLDAVMHLSLIFTHRGRVPRFLITHTLLRMPFLNNFLTKLGGVVANQENAARLFRAENLVAIFPEGIRGTFSPYKTTYRLRNFSKSGFARMAVENQAPIIPTAVIGHSEIFPILARIDSSFVTRELGWPYLPIAPMFPLAPVPIPSKWHVRILPPVPVSEFKPADAENDRLMKDFSQYIQEIVQRNIDDMVPRRKNIFWGKVLDGTAPPVEPFRPRTAAMSASAQNAPDVGEADLD